MVNLAGVIRQLRRERDRGQSEVEKLDAALAALGRLDGVSRVLHRQGRRVSPAARARMAAAQRARKGERKRREASTLESTDSDPD